MVGGGPLFPSHAVGILTGTRKDVIAATGERGPLPNQTTGNGEWADYLTVRPVFPDRKLFAATGFTMKGSGDGFNRDVTPRFVVFGRVSGASGVALPAGPVPKTPAPAPPVPQLHLPDTSAIDGAPITDVNTLPVVSASAAAKIKAAAGLGSVTPATPVVQEMAVQPQADKPGTERWAVKTGQDGDRAKVGKNVIEAVDLHAGIVEVTLEELISLPRPPGLKDGLRIPRPSALCAMVWQRSPSGGSMHRSSPSNMKTTAIIIWSCKAVAVRKWWARFPRRRRSLWETVPGSPTYVMPADRSTTSLSDICSRQLSPRWAINICRTEPWPWILA